MVKVNLRKLLRANAWNVGDAKNGDTTSFDLLHRLLTF